VRLAGGSAAAEARFVRRHATEGALGTHCSPFALGITLGAALAAAGCGYHRIVLPPPIAISVPAWPQAPPSSVPPPRPSAPSTVSTAQRASACAAALRAVERVALGKEPTGALLLERSNPPDTTLERALLRRHVIAGICQAASEFSDACTNGARGLTASFALRPAIGDSVALMVVRVRPMRAAGDRTWLVEPQGHSWFVVLWRSDSLWVAAAGAPSP